MITLISWAVISIIALIAIIMIIWFLFKNKDVGVEDEPDGKFICTDCNENHCECHKEEPFGNK